MFDDLRLVEVVGIERLRDFGFADHLCRLYDGSAGELWGQAHL